MSLAIPCQPIGVARWTQRTQLDGRDYQLTFQWNQRTGHWSLDLADQDGVAIRSGMVLVTGWPLLRGCVDARRPPGTLVIADSQRSNDLDPGFADLGGRFQLLYFTAAEIAS
jgi:hypothetical protein